MRYSFIIPVYNAENQLSVGVESILRQSFCDFEIILVNDGSSDGSGELCHDFEQRDSRIIAVDRENGGTSAARNTGLHLAHGEYIIFLDNDDFWDDSEALAKIDGNLLQSNADVLLFWMKERDEKTGKETCEALSLTRAEIVSHSASEAIAAFLHYGKLSVTVWTKVIKRSLIMQNGLTFPEGMRNEDTDFTAQVIRKARSYDWLGEAPYVYRRNTGQSQTSEKITYKQLCDLKTVLIRSVEAASEVDESLLNVYYSYLAFPYAVWLGYSMCDLQVEKKEFREMKKYAFLLKHNEDIKVRKLSLLYRLFGYTVARYALKIWVRMYRN